MTEEFDRHDLAAHRITGTIGYLIFFVPLLLCPDSRYGKFAANQGLDYLLGTAALWLCRMVLGHAALIGWLLSGILWLCSAALTVLTLYHMYMAIRHEDARELPLIGKYRLLH